MNYKILDKNISIKAGCFFQTNNKILQIMYADIYDVLIKNDNIIFGFILWCWLMSLIMNDFYKKCIGVEINKNSIKNSKL